MEKYSAKRRLGNQGEDAACQFLRRKGFRILERNYLRPWGEIDIVAEKGDTVRFIEVKTVSRESSWWSVSVSRERGDYSPEEQVHPEKLRKVGRMAQLYMASKKDNRDFQIDVVAVFLDVHTRTARCRLYEQVL